MSLFQGPGKCLGAPSQKEAGQACQCQEGDEEVLQGE